MGETQAPTEPWRASRFMQMLSVPWIDKTIAIVATLPFAWLLYERWFTDNLSFARAVLSIQIFILIITMVFRRTPIQVTPNPWFWLLAFVATYGSFAFSAVAQNGVRLVPSVITDVLAFVSMAVLVYARLSLGRSIGFVPANRGIVTSGIYRFVRHPMYTGIFIAFLAFVLRSYSPRNLMMASLIVALFMVKSIIEERVLHNDPEYAAYLRRVRWRWFPGVA